ncbi:MAG: FG-GAP repeat domain-containing protein [Thermoplasmatota archaeon]
MRTRLAMFIIALMISMSLTTFLDNVAEGEKTNYLYDNTGTTVTGGPISITEGGGVDSSYYFRVGKNVPISHAYFNISTHNSDLGQSLQDPYVDIGLDGRSEWTFDDVGYGKFGEQTLFSDDSTKKSMNIPNGGGYNTANKILVPQGAEITSADIGIMGRFIPRSVSPYTIMSDPSSISLQGYAMENGDIDQDGDLDIVVSDIRNDRILWLENPGNMSAEWESHTVYDNYYTDEVYSLDVGDMDGDGDLDVVCTSYSRGYVMYIRNNNKGTGWTMYRFFTGFRYAGRIRIGDIDKDGNPDVVVGCYYCYYYYSDEWLYWFKAPSNPNTTSGWSRYQIGSSPYYYMYGYLGMDLADMDGDGYLDVVASMYPRYTWYNYNQLYFYKNPKSTGSWPRTTIDSSANRIFNVDIADIDDDGKKDIVAATYDGNRITLYRQTSSGWSESTMQGGISNPRFVTVIDFDGDGKNDTLYGAGSGVYEFGLLMQGSSYSSWTKKIITQEIINPMAFSAIDMDEDDDYDFMVAGTSASQLVIMETLNQSNFEFKTHWIEDGGVKDIRDMDYTDMDGDGDQDMVIISYATGWMGWWENDGTPLNGAGKLHKLGALGNGIKVMLADVDGDGNQDVVALSSGGVVAWWRNGGDPFVPWHGYIVATGIPNAYSFYAGDFTGDGKADIVTSSARGWSGCYIRIYEAPSDPTQPNWGWNYVVTSLSYLKNIWADDMDQDGDLDVLAVYGTYGSGSVVYYRNPLPNGNPMGGSWSSVSIAGGMYYPEDVKTIDITDNGYPDVVTTGSYYYSKVRWFENRGGSSFTGRVLYTGSYDWNLAVGDIGNDGYADIIFNRGSYSSPSSIYWFEEPDDYAGSWIAHSLGSYSGTWSLGIADLEGDGVAEILSTSKSLDQVRAYWIEAIFPENVAFDIGADEADPDWSMPGYLKGKRPIEFKEALQEVIDNEPLSVQKLTDQYGTTMLSIPIEIYSQSLGKIGLEKIKIVYNASVKIEQDGSGEPLSRVLDRLIPDYNDKQNPYTRIYVGVGAVSMGMAYLNDLSVEFNAIPRQSNPMPELHVDEDTKETLSYDLKEYFRDDYTAPEDLHYRIKLMGPRADKIDAYVENDRIVLDSTITPNFYTRTGEPYDITAIIVVTDTGGPNNVPARSMSTPEIPVFVTPVNDPPTRTTEELPVLYAWEGETTVVVDLDDYDLFGDVDGDALQLRLVPDLEVEGYDPNAGFEIRWISKDNTISVSLKETSDWTGTIPVRMYATDESEWNYNQNPYEDFLVEVQNINDGPSWAAVPDVTVIEDTPDDRIIELTQYALDHDTPRSELSIIVDTWTNLSFLTIKAERTQDHFVYISFEPKIENWIGTSTVELILSDGEYSVRTTFDVEIEPVNDLPSIRIIEPTENGRIEPGTLSIVGESYDVEYIEYVEVYFNGEWNRADGTNNWGYTMEAEGKEEMQEGIPIMARVFDGEEFAYAYVNITIMPKIIIPDEDFDDDGVPNRLDDFEYDPSEFKDTDNDGTGDNADLFPNDPQWSTDKDGDGIPDEADDYPEDPENRPPTIVTEGGGGGKEYDLMIPMILIVIALILLILMVLSVIAFTRKRAVTKDPRKMASYYAKQQRWREKRHDFIENLPLAKAMDKVSGLIKGSGIKPTSSLPTPSRPGGPVPLMSRPSMVMPPRPGMPPTMPQMALPPIQRQPPNKGN